MFPTAVVIFLLTTIINARISHIKKAHSYLDLRIKLSPTDESLVCEADPSCSIPYAISVLHSPNHFDLQSIMMQDGGSLNYKHNRYSDSTVIRLTKAMKSYSEKIYVGLRFFDLPYGIQDYVIVDATAVIEDGQKNKLEIITEGYQLGVHVTKEMEMRHGLTSAYKIVGNSSYCQCIPRDCSCCLLFNIPKIRLHDIGCVNITYISKDIGLRLSFSINGHIYVSKELSVRNPPPFCFSVPYLKEYASVCLRLREVEIRKEHVAGCVELYAELYHVHVATVHVGCFTIPI